MNSVPELIHQATQGNTSFFLQFGGQGSPWLGELARSRSNPLLNEFFSAAFSVISEEFQRVKDNPFYEPGFDPEAWLADPDSAPSEDYLERVTISMPMIHLTQLANLELIHHSGFSRDNIVRYASGATGHSQGVVTASLLALGLSGNDYFEALKVYTRFLFRLALHAQETFPYPVSTDSELEEASRLSLDDPAPMAALVGNTHKISEELVDSFNKDRSTEYKVTIGLRNTPENRILSACRQSLIEFYGMYASRLEENDIRFVFLKSSCPFHSPLMEGVAKNFEQDLRDTGFSFRGSDLKIPVYSFFDGRNLQEVDDLAPVLVKEILIQPLYWEHAVHSVVENSDSTTVLDFGPGKVSVRFTQEALKSKGTNCEIFTLALPRDQKKILK